MPDQELVAAYLQGKINSWTFVRRLLKAGVTLGTALTFTALLPAAAQSGDLTQLEQLVGATVQNSQESEVLRLLMQFANSLIPFQQDGSDMPLRIALARLSLNVANEGGVNDAFIGNAGNVPFSLASNVSLITNENVVIDPNLVNPAPQNVMLNITGTVGEVPLTLNGSVHVNVNGRPGLRGTFLNVSGNVGNIEVGFNSDLEK